MEVLHLQDRGKIASHAGYSFMTSTLLFPGSHLLWHEVAHSQKKKKKRGKKLLYGAQILPLSHFNWHHAKHSVLLLPSC